MNTLGIILAIIIILSIPAIMFFINYLDRMDTRRARQVSDWINNHVSPSEPDSDLGLLIELIRRGALIGVEVFGTNMCCEHFPHGAGEDEDCPSLGFGLCDTFGPHSIGSDCNRAERWLLRPSDALMTEVLDMEIHDESSQED